MGESTGGKIGLQIKKDYQDLNTGNGEGRRKGDPCPHKLRGQNVQKETGIERKRARGEAKRSRLGGG